MREGQGGGYQVHVGVGSLQDSQEESKVGDC